MQFKKFVLVYIVCFILIGCNYNKNSVSTPYSSNKELNNELNEGLKSSIDVKLIYDLGDVNIVDAKIDNNNLYLLFNNIYSGNISSWGHLCLIDLNNIRNIKRSNVLWRPKRIAGIIDNTIFIHCSHDILPFNKNTLLREEFFVPGDPDIVEVNKERIYFVTSPPSMLYCYQREDKKLLWEFKIQEENYELLPYIYELDGKVFLLVSELLQSVATSHNYRLHIIVLNPQDGKELGKQSLSLTFVRSDVFISSDVFCSFKDNQMFLLVRGTKDFKIATYEISSNEILKEIWRKDYKTFSYSFFFKEEKDVTIGFWDKSKRLVVDESYIYVPYQEVISKNSSEKNAKKTLFALDRKTGKIVWKYEFSDSKRFESWIGEYEHKDAKGKVIFSTFSFSSENHYSPITDIHCLDRQNGKLIWKSTFNSFHQIFSFKENLLWLIEDNEKFHSTVVIDVNTGKILSSFKSEKIKAYNVYYSDDMILPLSKTEAIFVFGEGRIYYMRLIEDSL